LESAELAGTISGPFSRYARTLPARAALRDKGLAISASGERGRLADAILPDPCYWLPQSPYCYAVQIELRKSSTALWQEQRLLGICPLGTIGRNLLMAGRRWVLRGALCPASALAEKTVWHDLRESSTAILVDRPSDAICEEASHEGVLLVARIASATGTPQPWLDELDRLARWPAVKIVVWDVDLPMDSLISYRQRNVILAQRFAYGVAVRPAPWAQVAVCEGHDVKELAQRAAACSLPVVAFRPAQQFVSVREARAACDRLQRELAPDVDLAGYLA
jgi:hypothetical protein